MERLAAQAGPLAQAQHVLVHGMATSFTAAAIFDACALLVVLIAIRTRQAASPAVAAPSPAAEASSATAGSRP